MENITDSTDFDELYNDKQISIYERDELKDKWNKMSESEKKNFTFTRGKSTSSKKLSESSDREIQEKILRNLIDIKTSNNVISSWVTFLGITLIIQIIAIIIVYSSI